MKTINSSIHHKPDCYEAVVIFVTMETKWKQLRIQYPLMEDFMIFHYPAK